MNAPDMMRRQSVAAAQTVLEHETGVLLDDSASAMRRLVMEYGENDTAKLELVVSASPLDEDIPGECPHCQRVLMTLVAKRIPFKLHVLDTRTPTTTKSETIATQNLPQQGKLAWVAAQKNQLPPILKHNKTVICDVEDIVEYIEMLFPDPSLIPDDYDTVDVGTDLFGCFFRYLKNKRPTAEEGLKDKVVTELREIHEHLVSSGGPYLDGERLTQADCNLWPKLNHVLVSLGTFKGFQVPDDLYMIYAYIGAMMQTDVHTQTMCPDSWILARWQKYI